MLEWNKDFAELQSSDGMKINRHLQDLIGTGEYSYLLGYNAM
jgi:hypothetical protein